MFSLAGCSCSSISSLLLAVKVVLVMVWVRDGTTLGATGGSQATSEGGPGDLGPVTPTIARHRNPPNMGHIKWS